MPRETRTATAKRQANAAARAKPILDFLREHESEINWRNPDIYAWAQWLNREGFTAPRGGPVTFNVVLRCLERLQRERDEEAANAPPEKWVDPLSRLPPEDRARVVADFERELGLRK